MNRTTAPDTQTRAAHKNAPKPRAEIAAALFAGALTLFALADMPARAPASAVVSSVVLPAEQAPAPLRSASYYPEHLAALQSLSGFQPMADEGEKPPVSRMPLVALAKPAPFDPRAPRRAETKSIVAAAPAAAPGQAAQQLPAARPKLAPSPGQGFRPAHRCRRPGERPSRQFARRRRSLGRSRIGPWRKGGEPLALRPTTLGPCLGP